MCGFCMTTLSARCGPAKSHSQPHACCSTPAELLPLLGVNQPPSIKQYQEAIVAHLLLQHPPLFEELLLPQLMSVEKGGPATGSHILVAVQVALHTEPQKQLVVLPRLIKLLLPWTNHHTHNIRIFAQLGFCALLVSTQLHNTVLHSSHCTSNVHSDPLRPDDAIVSVAYTVIITVKSDSFPLESQPIDLPPWCLAGFQAAG